MAPPNGLAAGVAAAETAGTDGKLAAADADAAVVAAVAVVDAAVAVADAELSLRFVTVTVNWLAPPVVCAWPS